MPDIFDQLEAPPATAAKLDVFDEIESQPAGDIFDEVSGATPETARETRALPLTVSPSRKIPASNEERNAADFYALQKAGALPHYEEGQGLLEPLAKVAGSVTGQQVQDAFDYLNQKWAGFVAPKMGAPLSDQEKQELVGSRSEPPSTSAKVTAGAQNVAAGAANSFTSPLGIATLGQGALPQLAQRLVSLGFAVDMGRHLPEAASAAGAASVSGDAQEKTEAFGSLLVDAALITSLAKHGLTIKGKVPAEKQAAVLDDVAKTLQETSGLKKESGSESSPLAEETLPRAEKPVPQDVFDEVSGATPEPARETRALPGEKLIEEIRASAVPVKPATVEIEGQPGQQKLDAAQLAELQAAMRANQVSGEPVPGVRSESGRESGQRPGNIEQPTTNSQHPEAAAYEDFANEIAKAGPAATTEPAPETSTSLNEGKASEMLAEPVQRSSEASGDEPPAKAAGTSPGASLIPEAPAPSAGASSVSPDMAAHRARLLAKAAEYDRTHGVTITDVTPKGYGPEETGAAPDKTRLWADPAAVQSLRNSIAEGETLLKGKLPADKQGAIKRAVDSAKAKLEKVLNFEPEPDSDAHGVARPTSEAPELIQARNKLESLRQAGKGKSDQAFRLMARIARLETPKRVARGVTGRKRFNNETDAHGPDILSWIHENMPLLSKHQARELWDKEKFQANKSDWDGAPQNLGAPHHNVIYGGRNPPNIVAAEAYKAGMISEPSADALWSAIDSASKARLRKNARAKQEASFLKEEVRQHEAWSKATAAGETRIAADQLKPGDLFEVDGERIEVVDVNAETGEVTVKDGRKFGKEIHVESGQALHVEKFESGDAGEARPAPEPETKPPSGGTESAQPETIEQKPETLEQKLDKLKIDTRGTLQAFGLLPEAWNTLIDLVKTAVKAGRKINQAIDWAFAQFKELHPEQKFDEAAAREHFLNSEGGTRNAEIPVKWEDLKERVARAEKDLRAAIKAPAPDETAAAKSVREKRKAEATAKFREAEDLLYAHPDYLKHLYELQSDAVTRLRQIKEEASGATPDGAPGTGAVPEGVPEGLRFKLQEKIEEIDAELQRFPAKMRNRVYNELYGEPESALEKESNAELGTGNTELSERNPEPVDEEPELPGGKLQRAIAELPGHARELFKSAKELKTKLAQIIRRSPNRDVISYTKDAADNRANVFGRQAANLVLHEVNRAFGEKDVNARDSRREMALTFVIESGRDRAALDDFKTQLHGSEFRNSLWAKRALDAIAFAEKHWERFAAPATLYEKLTDAQVASENASGIATLHRSGGYVFHLNDVLDEWAALDGGGGGGPSAPFKHIRDYPTYAQSLAAGVTPKTLNAVDLLHRRLTLGRKLINYRAWSESMSDLVDPTTQLPIVADAVIRVRKDGTSDITAPPGYVLTDFAGQKFAIHRGYDGLLDDLTSASKFSKGTVRPVLMKAAATTKHLMLLFDTYHLGRLAFWNGVVRGGAVPGNPFAYKKGITLLDNAIEDIQQMARNGEIPKDWETGLLEQKRQLDGLLKAGLNVGSARDNVYADWIHKIPVTGKFNHWLFDQFQRGAMSEAALIELGRARKMYPKLTEAEVMRRVARDVNIRFGNLASQSWIKSKTFQDLARVVFLAPQWNESLVRAEMGAVKQIAMAPVESFQNKRLAIGTLGRSVGTAALGLFIANQIINYITRGHPTWENEEEGFGAKISAYIPDVVGDGPGMFHNPLVLPAEISHLLMEKTERSGDPTQAGKEFIAGRLGTVGRLVYTPLVREDEMGAKLRGGKEVGWQMFKQSIPVPISAGAGYRGIKQMVTGEHEELYPGQFEKQVFQTFGVKTQTAPDAERRIQALAAEFKKEKGIKPNAEFYHGDYYFLDRAARIGNVREMKKEMEKLLEKKSPADIRKHYLTWSRSPFSGSRPREVEFKATLSAEQLKVYERALEKRRQLKDRVLQLLP